MADEPEWIPARDALRLVMAGGATADDAKRALLRAAAGGLVTGRCRRSVEYDADIAGEIIGGTDRDHQENPMIQPSFWAGVKDFRFKPGGDWDQGHFDSVQGPFMSQKVLSAFQVSFLKEEVLALPGVRPPPPSPLDETMAILLAAVQARSQRAAPPRSIAGLPSAPGPAPVQLPVQISKAPAPINPISPSNSARPLTEAKPQPPASSAAPKEPGRKAVSKRRSAPKRPVTEADVRAWHAALSAEDQARGWRWLYPAAKKHFRPRHTAKQFVLALVEGRRLGQPPKRPR